jgi:hypothetical protein
MGIHIPPKMGIQLELVVVSEPQEIATNRISTISSHLQKNSGDFNADENLKGCTPLKIANTQRFFRAAHQMARKFPERLQFLPAGFGQATNFFLGGLVARYPLAI